MFEDMEVSVTEKWAYNSASFQFIKVSWFESKNAFGNFIVIGEGLVCALLICSILYARKFCFNCLASVLIVGSYAELSTYI